MSLFEESFSHDQNFAFAVDLYQPWDPHLTQIKFAKTAAAARAHGLGSRPNVYPVISLGASSRNHSASPTLSPAVASGRAKCWTVGPQHYPNINGMAKEVLRDVLRASERRITIEEIQRKVSDYYNIRISDIVGPKRVRSFARPRQIAMYLCKQLTSRSLPEMR